MVAVAAVAGSIGVWRYQEATSRYRVALDARTDAVATSIAVESFFGERLASRQYIYAPSGAALADVNAQHAAFTRRIGQVVTDNPAEACRPHGG